MFFIKFVMKQEGVWPKEIADRYHQEFADCFSRLGFSFDTYTRTDSEHHHRIVQEIFISLLSKGLIYKKEIEQTYCVHDQQFLPDRYVEGELVPIAVQKHVEINVIFVQVF